MYKIFILERDIPYTIYKNSNQVSLLLNNQKRKERKKNHAIIFRSNQNWQPNETSSFFFIDRTHQLLISTASQQYRSIHPLFPSSPFKNRYRLRIITETTNHTQLLLSLPPPLLYSSSSRKRSEKQTSSGREFVPIIRVSYHRRTLSPIRATLSRVGTAARGTNERTSELRTQTAGGINRFSFVWLISRRGGREKERGGAEGSGKGEEERRPV